MYDYDDSIIHIIFSIYDFRQEEEEVQVTQGIDTSTLHVTYTENEARDHPTDHLNKPQEGTIGLDITTPELNIAEASDSGTTQSNINEPLPLPTQDKTGIPTPSDSATSITFEW
jgi:hypothetical protein